MLDVVLLSRVQFGFTLAFHILFPTLTIGLAVFIVWWEALWLRSGDAVWLRLARFWSKLFALAFGIGVVSGIVLSFEVGTNFAGFSRATGNVLGPLFAYEVLTAFFLEASFLPIMLFGWGRVSPRLHLFATAMVALGTVLSAFWILSANSWMQTPAGHALRDGIFYPLDWLAIIFNPSFPYRLAHMLTASLVTGAFVVAGLSAWYLLRGEHTELARRTLRHGVAAAVLLAPTQVVIGDLHGLQVQRDQPVKVAAMEALWETRRAAPFVLLAWPDQAAEANRFELAIPYAASLILHHDLEGEVLGLDQVPPSERPNVPIVFFSFRVMLAIGFWMLGMALIGVYLMGRNRLAESRTYLRLLVGTAPLGFVAVVAGWVVAEVGRQPWVVHGLQRTADSASPVAAVSVAGSLLLFFLVYNLLLFAFLYYVRRLVQRGPEAAIPERLRDRLTTWYPA